MDINKILESHKKWLNSEDDGEKADLRGANLRDVDLYDADLRGADLRDVDLYDADLRGADLRDVDLYDADLRGADLRGANLCDADLCDADLRGADLRDADLCGANLCGANLRGANLRGANIDFGCLPLWCGSLNIHIDDKQAIQILYHLVRNVVYSKNIKERVKNTMLTDNIINLANEFHRVSECGEIRKTAPDAATSKGR